MLKRQSRDSKDALRCYPPGPEDGRIDWNKSAIDALRLVNASNRPYAGTFCEIEARKLIIWDAELLDGGEIYCAVPGQITDLGEHAVDVACGVRLIRIKQVEADGRIVAPRALIGSIRKRLS
jgi:methionyl-tRNA formyltransferase